MLQDRRPDRSGVPGKVLIGLVALVALAALGPRARVTPEWVEPTPGVDLDALLSGREATVPGLEAGEAKSVWWADTVGESTLLSVVYLHGFSADRHEVEPLVSDLARDLGANVYFARLAGHAQGGDAMGAATAEQWLADAAEAVAVGERIGERMVLAGTSTGATLALWAATRPEAAGRIAALVLVSPNLGLRDPAADVMLWPWGGVIARAALGRERCFVPENEAQAMHWTVCYPTRALLPMMALVDHVRSLDFSVVRMPTLVVYSRLDAVVDATRTEETLAVLGGAGPTWHVVEQSGDPANHVIAGDIMSPGTTHAIRERIVAFLVEEGLR
jgi:esterase/lipase